MFTPATRPRLRQPFSTAIDSRRIEPPSRASNAHLFSFALPEAPPLQGGSSAFGSEEEVAADANLAQRFAEELENWWLKQCEPPTPAEFVPLLERYEVLAAEELARAEAALQGYDAGPAVGARREALQAECAMLRGERLSWRLLLDLYVGEHRLPRVGSPAANTSEDLPQPFSALHSQPIFQSLHSYAISCVALRL